MHRSSLLAMIFVLVTCTTSALASGPVTWGNFAASLPLAGTPTTVSLAGGTTVDVTVTTGGTKLIRAHNLHTSGTVETGLSYDSLTVFSIFNGGGTSTVTTTIVYSNFQTGSGHIGGYLFLGGVNLRSSPITVTSSVPGAVQTWPLIGSAFDLDSTESWPITWDASSGHFVTDAPTGNDSRGIVVGLGNLAQYTAITLTLQQHLDDGITFSIGQELVEPAGVESPHAGARISLRNSPNPFTASTVLRFSVPQASRAVIHIYDTAGRLVGTPLERVVPGGAYEVPWNAESTRGVRLVSGTYFAELEVGGVRTTTRITLLR